MAKFPQLPFDLGRTGDKWLSGTRKTGPTSFKKKAKKTKKGK